MADLRKPLSKAGARGIRADGADHVRAIRQVVEVPIIGIRRRSACRRKDPDYRVDRRRSRPGPRRRRHDRSDCSRRGRQYGAFERISQIHSELGVAVLADIATLDEGIAAAEAGADAVLSTLRGYTSETEYVHAFDPAFIQASASSTRVPVIAEGRIHTTEAAAEAIEAGAFAVVVGTAITRPREIARRFVRAVDPMEAVGQAQLLIGIDLGGTATKFGLVTSSGDMVQVWTCPTPAKAGREGLLNHLKLAVEKCLNWSVTQDRVVSAVGIATAGWVDCTNGSVAYATDNLPGWTGTRIAAEVGVITRLPIIVENDANALAVGERHFGLGRGVRDFICITLGTGIGAGCYTGGRLNRGAHFFANALGHVPVETDGLQCTCGKRGCLEAYANAAALTRYAGGDVSPEEVIRAANEGQPKAISAIRRLGHYLARGCASAVQLLDPELLVLSGGLAENNPYLCESLEAELAELSRRGSSAGCASNVPPLATTEGSPGRPR